MHNPVAHYLSDIYLLLDRQPNLTTGTLRKLAASEDGQTAMNGAILLAARQYRTRQYADAAQILSTHLHTRGYLPMQAVLLLLALRDTVGETAAIPNDLLTYGCGAVQRGEGIAGAEAISLAFVEDARMSMHLIQTPAAIRQAARSYESIAANLRRPTAIPHADSPLRVGIVVANLVDHLVAYSNRALFFARFIDPSRFRLFVYSSENMCRRLRMLPFPHAAPPSTLTAPSYLAELHDRNVPVFLTPTDCPLLDAAQSLTDQIARDGIDVLLLQSGVTMPIDWLACRLAPVPVKMQIHIGLSALVPGLDLTLFDNAVNMEREKTSWPDGTGEVCLMRRGTDIDALDRQEPLARDTAGIPEDAVVIGVLSNELTARLTGAYLEVLSRVLRERPQAWFMPVGGAQLPEAAQQYFMQCGVLQRVVHLPAQHQVGRALKMMDIYASEFPVSGSQAVVEAMACGLPVAALRAGVSHYASIGADLIGPDAAIPNHTPEAYAERLREWIDHPDQRQQAGASMRRRALSEFHVRDFVHHVCDTGQRLFNQKKSTP